MTAGKSIPSTFLLLTTVLIGRSKYVMKAVYTVKM